jgi:hypothetical protein
MTTQQKRQFANVAGKAIVTALGGYLVARKFGPASGVLGAVVILALHEALDAPASNLIFGIIT